MIRGTTPTHIFNIPFEASTLYSARVVYKQGMVEIRKEAEDITLSGNQIKVTLTQEDTLKFDHHLPVKIQLRVKTNTGKALSTKPRMVSVDECLDGEVLA